MFCYVGFFDIHPPLGKLILAYTARFLGYRPDPSFVISKIGMLYPKHINFLLIRYISATFSVLTVPLTYIISREINISTLGGVLSTFSVLFDFLGIIEGRLILMDSQLLFFCQLTLFCALRLWKCPPSSFGSFMWLCATGFIAGAALSIKHTALATPGLVAIICFFGLHFITSPLQLWKCACAALCGLSVYVCSFYVMFQRLWHTGGKYDKFMPAHFQKTLIGSELYDPEAKRVSFLRLFSYLNRRMLRSNANIKKRHTWESVWYHWIINWRGVLYYVKKEDVEGVTYRSQIYLFGNPVVIFLTLLCVAIFVLTLTFSIRYRCVLDSRGKYHQFSRQLGTGIFLLSGWMCNLLPYLLVHRAAFIYHYLPGLFYGQLLSGLMIDFLSPKMRLLIVTLLCISMAAAFVYWSPWIYGLPLTLQQHAARRWLPRWT